MGVEELVEIGEGSHPGGPESGAEQRREVDDDGEMRALPPEFVGADVVVEVEAADGDERIGSASCLCAGFIGFVGTLGHPQRRLDHGDPIGMQPTVEDRHIIEGA